MKSYLILGRSIIYFLVLLAALASLAACNVGIAPTSQPASSTPTAQVETLAASPVLTDPPTQLPTETFEPTEAATPTETQVPTATATISFTLTEVNTPTPTITVTPAAPVATVLEARAFCRYGPGIAYLYSHELNAGDQVLVDGRNYNGSWLWVQPADLNRHCWASKSVVEVSGEVMTAPIVQTRLPHSTLYGPPEEVDAVRDGNTVTVSWSAVWMTKDDDRGYLIEASVCQNGGLIPTIAHVDGTSYTLEDDGSCSGARGKLYTVEKHGYTDPVEIPWP